MKKSLLLLHGLLMFSLSEAQSFRDLNTLIVNAYGATVSGTPFQYHSSIPPARESLLIRATDGTSAMEWTTAAVPDPAGYDYVSFVWLAGIGSSPGLASFRLEVPGMQAFTFHADGSDHWRLQNPDGAVLEFTKDMTDQHGDRFGFMVLTVPIRLLQTGQALSIRVTGGKHEKTSWYMTFTYPIENGLNFRSLPAIIPRNGKDYQLGLAGILHFGQPCRAAIWINDSLVKETGLVFGYNHLTVELPLVHQRSSASYRLDIDGRVHEGNITLDPVRPWRVNFVQHSHTDIGYTRPQTEILAEHLRYIDYALDYCDQTDSYPEEAKFRWTCEASWAVDEYLKCRPAAQVDRLLKRIAENRIEVTGMYFNFDELPDEQTLAASLQPLQGFRSLGIPVKTAMQNDVNGIAWCLADYYHGLGLRYLNMGTHGHRALICFDKPTLFWWESPSGKRMLAYRGEHYMIGNTVFKIHAGDFNAFEDELLTYLIKLEARGYEYDLISLQHSGFTTDNAPPSTRACEMIRQWNEKYRWPKLRTASATEFFVEMEGRHGDSFRVIRGAWPDWWTDGFGASAREVAAVRQAQSDLIANTAGLCMAAIAGMPLPEDITDQIAACNSALLFYTEHTVGYHASVREPFSYNTMEQRALKESYAWEAARRAKMLGESCMGLLQSFTEREEDLSLVVFNTLNHTRSGLIRVYIDHQIIPRFTDFSITDGKGKQAKARVMEHHSGGTDWAIWVDDIPAFGYKKYIIRTGKGVASLPPGNSLIRPCILENQWYRLLIDTAAGVITSLTDKSLGISLFDQQAKYKAGSFIYEQPANREQMEAFRLDHFRRDLPDSIWYESYEDNPLWESVRFRANTAAAIHEGGMSLEIRLFKTEKRIDLVYDIDKKSVTEPEGIYVAFPFALDGGQWAFDVQGGEVRPGTDQVPGSSNDWNTVQSYARLSNGTAGILLLSPFVPLMQFGGINTGRYRAGAKPESTHVYAWPMNNYWTTNFNAEQRGGHRWTFSISSGTDKGMDAAARTGQNFRTPLLCRVLPGGGKGDGLKEGTFLSGWPDNIILISAIPEADGNSAILQLRETLGKKIDLKLRNTLNGNVFSMEAVDVSGLRQDGTALSMEPFENRFFRLFFGKK
ncbi:MAG TPA: glycoside hydrolase family 38 C-terminal domain-containing protein [Bacteroidales bacterium]|nr:glycoside hydrolase family 38 C-terminal domain-containing protein [Bacteroidales bacterium]HSA44893.1 glycoside hydrolase family 38 C-terminal domain-containing protein [Bacteroidales bacterium]